MTEIKDGGTTKTLQIQHTPVHVVDYFVAKFLNIKNIAHTKCFREIYIQLKVDERNEFQWIHFSPTSIWAQGGPIIAKEKISISLCLDDKGVQAWAAGYGTIDPCSSIHSGYGDSQLESAMRAFLESKVPKGIIEVPIEMLEEQES